MLGVKKVSSTSRLKNTGQAVSGFLKGRTGVVIAVVVVAADAVVAEVVHSKLEIGRNNVASIPGITVRF